RKKYAVDFVVEGKVVVEIKALGKLSENEVAQLLNYMKAGGFRVGLLINFGARSLEWKRVIL
ncbi:MAG: GxxExxY protein, partial [Planctomycetota bacterium]|nr:GxxExxY protein [Planctomycetota bacterium]